MDRAELIKTWKAEEDIAHIHGWDFSHIDGRYTEETDLPWDYPSVLRKYLKTDMKILDMDTGGGEFLLSLKHPFSHTSATEGYPPNVELCKDRLLPLGIDFREAAGKDILPFDDQEFDLILNRHGDYRVEELQRILKKNGIFVTEQVGAENDRELVNLLLPGVTQLPFPEQYLSVAKAKFREAGFEILEAGEAFTPIRFFDVGALVWFARIIQWEFPGFTVEGCQENLFHAQEILEKQGCIEGRIHRFLLAARKK